MKPCFWNRVHNAKLITLLYATCIYIHAKWTSRHRRMQTIIANFFKVPHTSYVSLALPPRLSNESRVK